MPKKWNKVTSDQFEGLTLNADGSIKLPDGTTIPRVTPMINCPLGDARMDKTVGKTIVITIQHPDRTHRLKFGNLGWVYQD